jgi:hypothetical protein
LVKQIKFQRKPRFARLISGKPMINPRLFCEFSFVPLLLVFQLWASLANAESDPSGNWLDNNLNWNQVGASLPQAPIQEGNNLPNCQQTVRPAVLPEDRLVEAAGWILTDAAQIYGATTIVTGMADADGMCRPMDFQVFVFTHGKFSGTLSPILMDSRTDGSLFKFDLYREGMIDASFNRYVPGDAQCCASGESRVFYEVDPQSKPPLLVPQLPAAIVRNLASNGNTSALAPRAAYREIPLPQDKNLVGADPRQIARSVFGNSESGEGNFQEEVLLIEQTDKVALVTLTQTGLADDSVEGMRYRLEFMREGNRWQLDWAGRQVRCYSGRGSQTWTTGRCH